MTHPGHSQADSGPRLIAWEITRRCTLSCQHCRAAAHDQSYENELTLDEVRKTLASIAARFKPIIILTGGEPLLRPDLDAIITETAALGLKPVLATCGVMLTEERARELKALGIERISVSIDGQDAQRHDAFRGVPGAFEATLKGIEAAKRADLPFQTNTTITRKNADEIEALHSLTIELGAVAFHPFLLVPTGRGTALRDESLDAAEYERMLHRIYELSRASAIPFKPTCAPHYYRILRQREAKAGRTVTPQTHGLDAMSKGCMGGIRFAFISHVGSVQICGFLDKEAGDLRESSYDFGTIWDESPLFGEVRDRTLYQGDCGICEYWNWCGGCRARAHAVTGDPMAPEPYCAYTPEATRTESAS